jgi:UDP-GlcNAc:undecaprenyl-phosphate GlcNAc-1-phosphate transferase
MDYNIFFIPSLLSFLVSSVLLIVFILVWDKHNFFDLRNTDRHLHKRSIPRYGGVAIIIAFVAAIFLNKHLVIDSSLFVIILASLVLMILGVSDDIWQLSWKKQLFFQVLIVSFVCFVGVRLEYITNPFGGIFLLQGYFWQTVAFVFSVGWIVFIMNAMNWIDGIDGASGGVAFIAMLAIFFLSLRPEVSQPPTAIIAAAFLGAVGAFLLFNFYPAKIFAGTSGSLFMGFLLAILAIFAGAKIATTLLVLAIPVIDAFWVIGERIKSGVSVFSPDKRHLHFSLLDIGWSQKQICFFYYGVTVLVSVIALHTRALGKFFMFFLLIIFMIVFYVAIHQRRSRKNCTSKIL